MSESVRDLVLGVVQQRKSDAVSEAGQRGVHHPAAHGDRGQHSEPGQCVSGDCSNRAPSSGTKSRQLAARIATETTESTQ